MKRHWPRGVLLGVCLALLLAGGVALAKGITLRTDPEWCLECTRDEAHIKHMAVYTSGWSDNELLTYEAWVDGYYTSCPLCGQATNGVYNHSAWYAVPCPGVVVTESDVSFDVGAQANGIPLGEYTFRISGETSGLYAEWTILVAEVCEPEFVPEPGSIVLLGSGLVGLAGYATLRWRTRE